MIETMWQSFKRLEETMGLIAAERVGRGVRGIFQQESSRSPEKQAQQGWSMQNLAEGRRGKERRKEGKRRGEEGTGKREKRRGGERKEK